MSAAIPVRIRSMCLGSDCHGNAISFGRRTGLCLALLLWLGVEANAPGKSGDIFNVKTFGAMGDGKTLETAAINRAIKTCAQAGGGTVLFPAGEYLTGTFQLLNHVTLDLESGAVIEGSRELSDYLYKTNFIEHGQTGQSGEGLKAGIIIANKAENIGIIGHGVIDGQGTYFVNVNKPHYGEPPDFDKSFTRQGNDFMSPRLGLANEGPVRPWMPWNNRPGPLIILADCTNVVIHDVTLKDSHNWTLNIAGCEDVTISGIAVLNNVLIPNNDGINITAKNARISDCNITAGDDGIAANRCENLVVANCILVSRSSAIRFHGGQHCTFENLVIRDSNRGIGVYDAASSVLFSDILIQTRLFNGHWWGKSEPIHISVGQHGEPTSTPSIKDVRFSNIIVDSESGILIYGTAPHQIQDLSFDQIKLQIKNGRNDAAVGGNFDLRGLGLGLAQAVFKHDIPGLYCQYVDGLQIHNFNLEWSGDLPGYFSDGIHCEHFNNLTIDGFTGRQAQKSGGAAIALAQGNKVSIRNCEATEGTDTFLSLDHVKDERSFFNNDLTCAKQPIEPAPPDFKLSNNLLP